MSKLIRVNLGLSRELLRRIDAFAASRGLDRTNAIRLMLSECLDIAEQRPHRFIEKHSDKSDK